jgi:hypothetical protein
MKPTLTLLTALLLAPLATLRAAARQGKPLPQALSAATKHRLQAWKAILPVPPWRSDAPRYHAPVEKLLADHVLMNQMLIAGGPKFSKYGRAVEIYTAIQKVSPKAREGTLQRLALATTLEHAVPIEQSKSVDQPDAPAIVDPVKRYLHYEKAYLDGELHPAFKDFSTWEYRMVVNCDAPDQILAWGREMLPYYRPDHIYNPDYGWRYAATVRTEVPYGSQNVKYDLPSLHNYQTFGERELINHEW